jgi:hypothetical protein
MASPASWQAGSWARMPPWVFPAVTAAGFSYTKKVKNRSKLEINKLLTWGKLFCGVYAAAFNITKKHVMLKMGRGIFKG